MKKRFTIPLVALGCVAGYLAYDRIGWMEIPTDPPVVVDAIDPRFADVAPRASDLLRRMHEELDLVGISAAVSVEGKLVWAAAVGWSDLEQEHPLTPRSILRIGSTSKALTATVLARLVDEGTIELDEPIESYLQGLPNPEWSTMTARQLASHMAGLPGYEENRDIGGLYQSLVLSRHYDDVFESLEIFDDTSLLYRPGTGFHYSSFDVNLMAAVMQSAAHESYLDLLRSRVLEPLEMHSTGGDGKLPDPTRIATFYETHNGKAKRWRDVDLSQKWPSGGLLSTSSDLVKLCGGWTDEHFIESHTVRTFWEPQRLATGEINAQSYAIGWRAEKRSTALGESLTTERYHHGGVSKGAMSWLVCYPEYRIGIALNINTVLEDFMALANAEPGITRLFIAELGEQMARPIESRGIEIESSK